MKYLKHGTYVLLVAGLFFCKLAVADHIVIVACEHSALGIRVITADANIGSGITGTGKAGRPCSEVLHEIMAGGYEIMDIDPVYEKSQMVFVLKKTAH